MKTYLYRVLENDDEGDPLDFGFLRARDENTAWVAVRRQLGQIFGDPDEDEPPESFLVRLYPLRAVKEGVYPSDGHYIDREV
jgi:hypothetical protein